MRSSELYRSGPSGVEFRNIKELNQDIGLTKLYVRTKLARVLLCRGFYRCKKLGQLGLKPDQAPWINATHPGAVSTDQPEQAIQAYGKLGKIRVKAARPLMKDPVDEGCQSILFVATSDAVAEKKMDGEHIVPDCKVTSTSSQAQDEQLQERCWNLVEGILTQKLAVSY
ncbi:hypothetical protein F5Y08DRAFT_336781 [Xylaria arbuscula]|nr:hypothetical protein F5Y08DRAFT_336781 [Xylaria arbuscula]